MIRGSNVNCEYFFWKNGLPQSHTPRHERERERERQVGVKFLATGSPVRKPEKDVRARGRGRTEDDGRKNKAVDEGPFLPLPLQVSIICPLGWSRGRSLAQQSLTELQNNKLWVPWIELKSSVSGGTGCLTAGNPAGCILLGNFKNGQTSFGMPVHYSHHG